MPLLGSWTGTLNNAGETLRLYRPDEPSTHRLAKLAEIASYDILPFALGQEKLHRNSRHHPPGIRAYGLPKLIAPEVYHGELAPTRMQVEADVLALYSCIMRRSPSAAETTRLADFLEKLLQPDPEPQAALATAMQALIMTPESIHRLELGLGTADEHDRRMLSEQEFAIAVPAALATSSQASTWHHVPR